MNTKEKILEQSKELFNINGIQPTTLRQIASALEMSQGNLNYHFKTKQDIVERLYFDLVEKMDREMAVMTKPFPLLSAMYAAAEKTMKIFYEYRFLLRDMYMIFREYSIIKEHYIELQVTRKRQSSDLFNSMIEKKILRNEAFKNEYDRLYERMTIVGDNWINASELFRVDKNDSIEYYRDLMFEMLFPYLTEVGKKEYRNLLY